MKKCTVFLSDFVNHIGFLHMNIIKLIMTKSKSNIQIAQNSILDSYNLFNINSINLTDLTLEINAYLILENSEIKHISSQKPNFFLIFFKNYSVLPIDIIISSTMEKLSVNFLIKDQIKKEITYTSFLNFMNYKKKQVLFFMITDDHKKQIKEFL